MNTNTTRMSLDPLVAKKLLQFKRRRLRLIVMRGLCAGIATFLICMSIVALFDWYWLLTDDVRWLLSGGAYVIVISTVWATSVRKLMHKPALAEIATQMELSEPLLRENLLSAVELATDDPDSIHDSPVFRGLLQGNVAQQMGHVQVSKLLPVKLVAKWALAAVALAAVVGSLLVSGDTRYRQLALRAMVPGANIARVSRIQVKILQPTPHSLMLAEDETIAVVVEVTGGSVREVTLETFTPHQGSVKQTMRDRTDVEFAANLHVADESVEYRILAGDAVTQRFRIESRPRPRVTAFHKTFEYPKYSQLPAITITETHGDLLVLEGTRTQLVLETDQAVTQAELRIDTAGSDELTVVPLSSVSVENSDGQTGTRWQADVPVAEDAIYKVHLVSKETGFENLFSPSYEIRPQPDLIPRTGFVDQQEATLLLPPNDILALKGMAEDDLPLVSLEQQISVNGRDWEVLPLTAKPSDGDVGRQLAAAWQWDLLGLKLKTGDQVMTKLVATDRKGNTGESIPLRILVAAPEFDPERHTVMERKVSLYEELANFSALLEEHKTLALEAIERLRLPAQRAEQVTLEHTSLLDLATKQREQAALLLEQVQAVEKEMPPGADAYDLELTGSLIARLQREYTNTPAFLLETVKLTKDANRIKSDLDELKRTFERTADDAKNLAYHYQHLISHNYLTAIAFDLDAILKQQSMIVKSPTQSWDRLLRQETIVVNQLRDLERLIRDHRRRLPEGMHGQLNSLLTWSESQRQRIEEASESEEQLVQLQKVSKEFLQQLEGKQRMDVVDGGLPARLVGARRDLINRAGSLYVPINELARAAQQENSFAVQSSEAADSGEGQKLLDQAERFRIEIELKHRRSIEQLPARRALTQGRRDPDSQYGADAGLTHRAVSSLLFQHREQPPKTSTIPENLLEVAPAYRTLEAGHQLKIVRDALNVLINMERWESQSLQSHMNHPRQWDVVNHGFEFASQRLREAGVKNELVQKLDELRWSEPVRDAGDKIGERRWKRDAMVSAGHELTEIRDQLSTLVTELEPVMAEARAIIAKYAPTIPQMARQAADQLRELEAETTEVADAAEDPKSPKVEQQLAELQENQNTINQQISDLFEALVEDANAQDILEAEQRERARDADDSIAMIQEPATEMNRALNEAQTSETNEQQAKELSQAAEQQEKTAQALEMVAAHFAKLDEGLDVAASREELRQAERELGIARQMEERFENAELVSDTTQKNAEQLLKELEAELKQNPAMQQALSEISQNTLQEARNALESAAIDDENLQRSNEQSDAEFKAKKKEIAEELRAMGQQASQLANAFVAQANQSANQGKTPEAQKKLDEAQQTLNEVAQKANQAREDLLLADLTQTAQETKDALREATETLKQAKQETAKGKDEQIHADDRAKENQKKDSEKRRQQFHDQQKRTANEQVKRAEDAKRRADQNVQKEDNNVKKAEQNINKAKAQLDKKPDDGGLQNNLKATEAQLATEQQKMKQAKQELEKAEQNVQQARKDADEVNRKQMSPLNAANPATQLADEYTEEAIKIAEKLNQQAEELARQSNFGTELAPSKDQLAYAEREQKNVTQNVEQVAEDVARAARHERRLDNTAAAEPLNKAAENIQQVAKNESTQAEQQLNRATSEAEQSQQNGQQKQPGTNGAALQAQKGLETAENALANQADQLTQVLEPLLAAAEMAANLESGQGEPAGEPMPGEGQQPQSAQSGEAADPQPTQGQQPQGQSLQGQPATPEFTPEQMKAGQQLARTLDELDRQQAATQQNALAQGEPAQPARPLDVLAQAAQAQQAAMATARSQAQQQAAMAMGLEQAENPSATGPLQEFDVLANNRDEDKDWGKLRDKSAEDLTKGKSEEVSEEYRKSVETYFRVLAERAREKK